MPCPYHLDSLQEFIGDDVFSLDTPRGRRFLSRYQLYSPRQYKLFLFDAWLILVAMPKTAAEWRDIVDNALFQSEVNNSATTEEE